MPLSPQQRMKLSANKQDSGITLSEVEKAARRTEREEKSVIKKDEGGALPQWVVVAVAVIILGSVVTQLYFQLVTSPSMSKER